MSDLKDIALSFQCKEPWDKMQSCDGGKFCQVCQKIVYDFSNFTKEEYQDFLDSKRVPFCGNYKVEQTVYHKPKLFSFQKWAYNLFAILGFISCEENTANDNTKQENDTQYSRHTTGVPVMPKTNLEMPESKRNEVRGEPIPSKQTKACDIDCFGTPQYKYGGEEGMNEFFQQNIVPQDSIWGKVTIEFEINKKGKVIKSKILKSLSPANDKEALRVINLLEFEESKRNVNFRIPIEFAKE